jgi:hypothetical protein
MRYKSELTEREIELAEMHPNKMFWHLKREEEMTEKQVKEEIDRIKRKIDAIESFEIRQIMRGQRINQAMIDASLRGSNEILIMSEV